MPPKNASCWVEDREETVSPTEPAAKAKTSMPAYRISREPFRGTPRPKMVITINMVPWMRPIMSPGVKLAMAISIGVAGEARSWSKVPVSLSLAAERSVTIRPSIRVLMPIRLGRKYH